MLFGEEERKGAWSTEEEGANGAHQADIAGLQLIHQLNARLTSRRRAVQHSLGTRRRQTVKGHTHTGRRERERERAQWLPVLWRERREDILHLVTLGSGEAACPFVQTDTMHPAAGRNMERDAQSRRAEREREREGERGIRHCALITLLSGR